jgi:hypothetical protein
LNKPVLQLNRVKRFSEIALHTELFETQFLFFIAGTTDHNDRNIGVHPAAPKVGEELKTCQTRHQRIGHNYVGRETLTEAAHGFKAVFRSGYIKTSGKKSSDDLTEAVMIFHEEDFSIHGSDLLIGQQSPVTRSVRKP